MNRDKRYRNVTWALKLMGDREFTTLEAIEAMRQNGYRWIPSSSEMAKQLLNDRRVEQARDGWARSPSGTKNPCAVWRRKSA